MADVVSAADGRRTTVKLPGGGGGGGGGGMPPAPASGGGASGSAALGMKLLTKCQNSFLTNCQRICAIRLRSSAARSRETTKS